MQTDTRVNSYANDLLDQPRAHLSLELRQDKQGLTLRHDDKLLVECFLTRHGMALAYYMAEALGVTVPPLDESVDAKVSTGVLFRAISIATLDLDVEESFILMARWLDEAQAQRSGTSDIT